MKTATLITACLLLTVATAGASVWGGHHGTIHLSFDAAEPVAASTAEPLGEAGVIVDVHAILTDLDPILHEGERVMACGGYELRLGIEGADDCRILSQTVPVKSLNTAEEPGACRVGLYPDIELRTGSALLVSWKVQIPGDAKPIRFVLEQDGVHSDANLEGAADSGSYALWSGSLQLRQHGLLFSAGFVPAYLNWDGEPDLTEIRGTVDWEETGHFTLGE